MRQTLHRIGGMIAVVLAAAAAPAQDIQAPAAPARYEIELIVFRHLDQSRNTPEIPAAGSLVHESPLTLIPADDPAISFMKSLQYSVAGSYDSGVDTPILTDVAVSADEESTEATISFYLMDPRAEFPDFVPISAEFMALGDMYEQLERLDAYAPIMHLGWIQTAREASEATPYRIGRAVREAGGVSGTITLYKQRYLHLELELSLDENRPNSVFYTREIIEDMRNTGRMIHKLQESRRIRKPSSHYFDHPLFGVIARIEKVSPVKTPNETDPNAS